MTSTLPPELVRRILVIRLSSLGDVLHAIPAVHGLKAAAGADIDWLVQPEYEDIVRACPDVRRALRFPRRRWWLRAGWLQELRRDRYDLVVDLQGLLKSAIPTRLARAGRRIGPSFHREGAAWLYDDVAGPRDKNRHAVEENLDVLRYLGWPTPPVCFPLKFPPAPVETPRPQVVMAPASRWPTKNWPPNRFAAVASALAELGAAVVLVGSQADREICDQIAADAGAAATVANLAGRTTLRELGSLLAGAALAITVDSGPMHLAAALGVPVIALFGPTDPRRTGPYGPAGRVVQSGPLPCRPCFSARCARRDLACLRDIGAAAVIEAAREVLARARG